MTHPYARIALASALTFGLGSASMAAVPVPGAPQQRPIALIGATLHTIAGTDIPNGTILFDRGRIVALGREVAVPADVERVDVSGKHVYPGLVDPYSVLGLAEVAAVRATRDYSEIGDITPNVKAQVAVNPESEAIPVTRSNGVLTALVAPRGRLLRGSSALMMLDGWTWEEMTLQAPVAVHVNWPAMELRAIGVQADSLDKLRTRRNEALQRLQDAFDEARAYWTAKKAGKEHGLPTQPLDARWEAMTAVFDGKIPVIVEADEVQQIEAAVAFAEREKIRLIVYGGYEAGRCTALLKKHRIPVIVSATHRLPERNDDGYDAPFTLPERLRQAGIAFCIANEGGFWNERNLPYQAALAAAYGLPHEEALRAVTLYPAQILGAADRLGSLEIGKDATLIVTNGDPLEIPTRVEQAFIQGRRVDLQDKQKVLWDKYREKYRRLERSAPARAGATSASSGRN
jgi:imidazolonepropionase-like amidohydrolase